MDLKKFLPGLDKKEKEEFYWALIIEPGWVQAGIWKIVGDAAEVTYTSQPVAWEMDTELVSASDTVLSAAIQNFPEDSSEPTKTVFGVSYGWIKDGEIAHEHLEKIKNICTELSLAPVGFVVMAEAITHLIKSETGASVNSIVLGIYKQNLELSLFDKGKLVGTTQIARSVSLIEDVVEGLTRLATGESLPSGILIYDGREGDLEDARQDLLKVDWENYENIKFLHSPKIEVINSERKVFAVSLAGASELAGITSLVSNAVPDQVEVEDVVLKNIEPPPQSVGSDENLVAPEDMGFVVEKGADFTEANDVNGVGKVDSITSEEDLGLMESNVSPASDTMELEKDEVIKKSGKVNLLNKFTGNFSGLLGSMRKVRFKSPNISGGTKPFVWGGIFLILFGILAGVFWWFVPKATVVIYLSSKKLEEKIELSIDTSITEPDFGSKLVPGKIVDTSISGEKTADTTGSKTVGDKASGEVTIYRVGPQLSLSAGTLINGPSNLKFVIENSVSVASGSAITQGETKVSVSAQDIGAQYNLAEGTTFSVGNYSENDMGAKNDSSFSGGSSRDIRAVSKEDQSGLQEELTQELADKAEDELALKVGSNEFLINESLESSGVTSDFNNKVGDEANSLTLKLNLKFAGIVVSKDHLAKISEEALKGKVSEGFVLNNDQLSYSFGDIKKDGDKFRLIVQVVANLLPDVNNDDIKSKIKGRQIQIAKNYLQAGIPAFTRVEIKIKPSFPGKLKTLPHLEKNIEVQFSADR
jgi:hypothetical protein